MRQLGLIVVLGLAAAACGPEQRSGGGNGDVDAGVTADADLPPPVDGTSPVLTFVYAHTASTLYRVDPDTLAITMVGNFAFTTGSDEITDIAIDRNGQMIGISFTAVYRIDPMTAAATRLSTGLTGMFNGLSFVPATQLGQTGEDVLVATRNANGAVFRIDPMTGATSQVGNMGSFASSGDLVSIEGFGTVPTAVSS